MQQGWTKLNPSQLALLLQWSDAAELNVPSVSPPICTFSPCSSLLFLVLSVSTCIPSSNTGAAVLFWLQVCAWVRENEKQLESNSSFVHLLAFECLCPLLGSFSFHLSTIVCVWKCACVLCLHMCVRVCMCVLGPPSTSARLRSCNSAQQLLSWHRPVCWLTHIFLLDFIKTPSAVSYHTCTHQPDYTQANIPHTHHMHVHTIDTRTHTACVRQKTERQADRQGNRYVCMLLLFFFLSLSIVSL